tara:strand:+ start:395 stop:634 length:240 start_codon:yes stop_codon:yes gene_type:complete
VKTFKNFIIEAAKYKQLSLFKTKAPRKRRDVSDKEMKAYDDKYTKEYKALDAPPPSDAVDMDAKAQKGKYYQRRLPLDS